MKKIGDIVTLFKRKFSKEKLDTDYEDVDDSAKEMAIDTPEGNKSMRQGDHGQILGVDRKIVTAIAVFFVVIFALAFIYASSGSDDKAKLQNERSLKETDIAGTKAINDTNANKLNDDYGELERANRKKMGASNPTGTAANNANKQGQQATQAQPGQQPANNTVVASQTTPSQLPAVPRTNVVAATPGSYGQNYSLPSQSSGQSAEEKEEAERQQGILKRAQDKLSSAIAFIAGSSGGGNKGSSGTTQPASAGNAAQTAGGVTQQAGNAQGVAQGDVMQLSNVKPTYTAPTPNTLTAGTIIPAMLVTGINSDSPGMIYAQVMADVYDLDGNNILIPAGSKVLGKIDGVRGETGRVNVSFSQLVMPNGGAWNVGNSFVAIDGAGYSGLRGKVNKHTGSNFMKGIFNSAVTALSTIAVDRVTIDGSAFTAMTQSQQPTTTVDPGYMFSLYVVNNIQF